MAMAVGAWYSLTARKPMLLPDSFSRVRGVVLGVWNKKRKSMANSWSGPREANEKLPLTHFHSEGEKTFGQRPREGRVCINCEAHWFPPSALFVNALIVPPGFENPVSHHMSPTCRWLSPRVERVIRHVLKHFCFFCFLTSSLIVRRNRRRLIFKYIYKKPGTNQLRLRAMLWR